MSSWEDNEDDGKMLRFVQVIKQGQEWMRLINERGNNNFSCSCEILHDCAN